MRLLLVGGLAAVLLAGGARAAETARPAPPIAASRPAKGPSEAALGYARRYVAAIELDKTFALIMDSLGPALIEGEAARRPDLTERDKQILLEVTTETLVGMTPEFGEAYAIELAGLFTEDELRQLAEFYESPVGRSYMSKIRDLSDASERAMGRLLPDMMRRLEQNLCSRVDCRGTAAPTTTST